jgi:hypothetical protein
MNPYDVIEQAITDLAETGTRSGGVAVHSTGGCRICASTQPHIHTQAEWRAMLDAIGGRR